MTHHELSEKLRTERAFAEMALNEARPSNETPPTLSANWSAVAQAHATLALGYAIELANYPL